MKKFLVLVLAMILSGCSALAPVSPTAAPPPTAQVIIATVLVPVVATQPSDSGAHGYAHSAHSDPAGCGRHCDLCKHRGGSGNHDG